MKFLLVLLALLGMTQVTLAFTPLLALAAFKGAALGYIAGRAGRRRGGFGRRGFGGYGRGYGYGRGRGYGRHGRFGRDLTSLAAPAPEAELEARHEAEVEAHQLDAYFAAIALGDEDGCGLRLVCELSSLDPAALGHEESMVLTLFGDDVPSSGRPDSPKLPYDQAAALGRSGSAELCAATFRRCPHDARALVGAMHDAALA